MHPARGDQKQCTTSNCGGIMQFRRPQPSVSAEPSQSSGPGTPGRENAMMWICKTDPEHVNRDTQRT